MLWEGARAIVVAGAVRVFWGVGGAGDLGRRRGACYQPRVDTTGASREPLLHSVHGDGMDDAGLARQVLVNKFGGEGLAIAVSVTSAVTARSVATRQSRKPRRRHCGRDCGASHGLLRFARNDGLRLRGSHRWRCRRHRHRHRHRLRHLRRHCEERSDAAVQEAAALALRPRLRRIPWIASLCSQ